MICLQEYQAQKLISTCLILKSDESDSLNYVSVCWGGEIVMINDSKKTYKKFNSLGTNY